MVLICVALATLATFPQISHASQLDNFEYQATKSSPEKGDHKRDDEFDDDDSFSSCLGSFFGVVVEGAADGIREAGDGAGPTELPGLRHRPVVRFDYSYQSVKSDIRADDFRLEVGQDQFAVQIRTTHYRESRPKDDLELTEGYFLYRIASRHLDVDLGIGALNLAGNDSNTGGSLTLPLALHANDYLGVEFRPSWSFIGANTIGDYDLALACGWKYVALRGGYRWVQVHGASLDGPYLGISLRY